MTAARPPFEVSNRCTVRLSPEFISRFAALFGMKCCGAPGFAGAVDLPFLVTNAEFTGSGPTVFRHAVLLRAPVFSLSANVSMFIAAHHCVAVQPIPAGHGAQPGG